MKASRSRARRFYRQFCALLEEGRASGNLDFRETRITAQAACSLPGFLYNWYRPGGRLGTAEMVAELTELASRVLGLRTDRKSTRLNSSHLVISYAVFCLKKKKIP